MSEDLKKNIEKIKDAIVNIKAMDNITISDIYEAKKEYSLSDEEVRFIFSL